MILAHDPALAPHLLEYLKRVPDGGSPDECRQGLAAVYIGRALGKLGSREVVPALIELVRETPPERESGLRNKAYLRDSSRTPCDDYLARAPRRKAAYCYALGRLGDERAVPVLAEVLAEPRHVLETRYAAAVALGMIGPPSAVNTLTRAKQDDIATTVRRACDESLRVITGENPYAAVYSDFPGKSTDLLFR
jgi:HEAT repeat protein